MGYNEIVFEQQSGDGSSLITESPTLPTEEATYPKATIRLSEDQRNDLVIWLDEWLQELDQGIQKKREEWAQNEIIYAALPEELRQEPFVGSCNDVIPIVASAVDPIHARIETGIFRNDPVFKINAINSQVLEYVVPLEQYVQFYVKSKLKLRQVLSPRIMEFCKHGTMVLKTVMDREICPVLTYDDNFKPVKQTVKRFHGPRIHGVELGNFMFPSGFQDLQHCPIVAERQLYTEGQLRKLQSSGYLVNVSDIIGQQKLDRNDLERTQDYLSGHPPASDVTSRYEIFECWCDYDIDGDGYTESVVVTYHRDTRTILQCRLNWYFHQRKPYTVIPYTVRNGTLYGLGITEMATSFQDSFTAMHRNAWNNSYLQNIKLLVAKKNCGIEEVPRFYTGRVFFVDNPKEDLIPFSLATPYGEGQAIIAERQNLLGILEKRTGVSDYLVGRESPVVGSRATATSTMALINEGTRRVESVMENMRAGLAEVMENCFNIWIQYGVGDVADIAFKSSDTADKVKLFFGSVVDKANVGGQLSVDLAIADSTTNRAQQQQIKMAILQVTMQYYQKLVEVGQLAVQSAQSVPILTEMLGEVMTAARKMFKDILTTYDIRNPDEYLPDLEDYLQRTLASVAGPPGGGQGGLPGGAGGSPGVPGMAAGGGPPAGYAGPGAQGGGGNGQPAGLTR